MSFPKRQIKMVPIGQLKPYERNARTHSDAQIDQIAASLREFGWTNPVLVDGNGGIIAGHARVQAAMRLGFAHVPCIELAGLSEAQKRTYIIADNKLALNAGWDEKLLALEFADLKNLEFSLDLTGFGPDEIDALIAEAEIAGGQVDPDEVPAAPKDPLTVPGDLWILGKHRLLCGDATNPQHVERLMGGVLPGLMVTDPPYGVEYDPSWRVRAGVSANTGKMGKVRNDDRADWREAWSLFPGDIAYVWHASLHTAEVLDSLKACDFEHRAMIIWAKDRFTLGRGHYHWQHEPCWYAVRKGKSGNWNGDRSQTTVWNIKAREDAGHGHGTQKPTECMRRPILNHTNPGQCVYDPFLGSGTTIISAESVGRICFGLELDPVYVDVCVERWQTYTGKHATLEGDGSTFEEINAQRRGGAVPLLQEEDLCPVQ